MSSFDIYTVLSLLLVIHLCFLIIEIQCMDSSGYDSKHPDPSNDTEVDEDLEQSGSGSTEDIGVKEEEKAISRRNNCPECSNSRAPAPSPPINLRVEIEKELVDEKCRVKLFLYWQCPLTDNQTLDEFEISFKYPGMPEERRSIPLKKNWRCTNETPFVRTSYKITKRHSALEDFVITIRSIAASESNPVEFPTIPPQNSSINECALEEKNNIADTERDLNEKFKERLRNNKNPYRIARTERKTVKRADIILVTSLSIVLIAVLSLLYLLESSREKQKHRQIDCSGDFPLISSPAQQQNVLDKTYW